MCVDAHTRACSQLCLAPSSWQCILSVHAHPCCSGVLVQPARCLHKDISVMLPGTWCLHHGCVCVHALPCCKPWQPASLKQPSLVNGYYCSAWQMRPWHLPGSVLMVQYNPFLWSLGQLMHSTWPLPLCCFRVSPGCSPCTPVYPGCTAPSIPLSLRPS